MRITRAAKIAAIPLTALVLVALIACQGPVGPAGADGAKGDPGTPGAKGDPGKDGTPAPTNKPPTLSKEIDTQYLALEARSADGTAITEGAVNIFKKFSTIEVSKNFTDPEGVTNLIYSLADLSDDDKEIVTVSLAATKAEDGRGNLDPDGDIDDTSTDSTPLKEMPAHAKSVTGTAWLNISGKKEGSVTLTLMVKDGQPGGTVSGTIKVEIRKANAPPVINTTTVLTAAKYTELSRIGTKRIPSNNNSTVTIPSGAFTDPNNDMLMITAEIGGTAGDGAGSITANKKLLDVEYDQGSRILTLKPKKGGNNTSIPVVLKAADQYGAAASTSNDSGILVEINTPPMHEKYTADQITGASNGEVTIGSTVLTLPAGAKADDKIMLAHIKDKTFSVSVDGVASTGDFPDFIVLDTFFDDPDGEDDIGGANNICAFATSPADQKFATVRYNTGGSGGEIIEVNPKMQGTFDLSVTCTDKLGETVTEKVKVTIIQ